MKGKFELKIICGKMKKCKQKLALNTKIFVCINVF